MSVKADAPNYIFGYATGMTHRTRLAAGIEPMDVGKTHDGSGAAPPLSRPTSLTATSSGICSPSMAKAAEFEHFRPDLQLQTAGELYFDLHDAQARRHHLHRTPSA